MWANLTNSQPPWKSKGKAVGNLKNSTSDPSRSSSSSSSTASTFNPMTSPISSSNSTPPSSPHLDTDSRTHLALRRDKNDGVIHTTHQNRDGARVTDPIKADLSIQSMNLDRERTERQSRTSSVGRNQSAQGQAVGQSQSTASEFSKGTFNSSKGMNLASKESSESKEVPTLLINPSLKSINPPASTSVTRSDSKSQNIPIQPKAIRPMLEPSTSQANLLEESLQEAMVKDEIPNLISPPVPARLPSPITNHSPVTSRPTSRNNVRNSLNLTRGVGVGGGLSRVSTPDRDYDHEYGRNSNTSSPLKESRKISNDLKNAIGEALNSSSPTPSPDKSTSSSTSTPSRPSLLSQLSSRSTRSTSIPQLNIFGDVITTISSSSSERNQNQNQPHTLLTRPQSTWFPDESSPSSKRHSRAFSQVSRAGIVVGDENDEMVDQDGKELNWDGHNHEMILDGEGLNLEERLNGDVEDRPGFWNTISKGFGTQLDNYNSTVDQNQIENGVETSKVEEGQTGFLDAISRLRSLIGPAEPESPNKWIKDHEKQLSSALAQSSGTGSGEGKGKETSGEDLESSNLSKKQLLRLQDKYQSPRLPIVLCVGLFGFKSLGIKSIPSLSLNYWRGVTEVLEANGTEVLVTEVPVTASIQERAACLRDLIEDRFAGREINLIGHSMGGLDGRHLISNLKDYMINEVIGKDRLPTLLNALKTLKVPGEGGAFQDLTIESMSSFNEVTKDDPECLYFSWGASFRPGFLNEFRIPWGIIHAEEGENDGLVSVSSSIWGQYQGTLDDVSHLHLIGWVNKPLMAALGRDHFRPTDFYLQICEDLAKEGL